jgi:hypothetical protein
MAKKFIGGNTIETDAVMRPRAEYDYYRTDPAAIEAYFRKHPIESRLDSVFDPCMGDGVWGVELRKLYPDIGQLTGNDIQRKFLDDPTCIATYDELTCSDFLENTWEGGPGFDLIMANPPFKHAEEFFHQSRRMIDRNGTIVFLVRLGFLASERRHHSMYSDDAGLMPTNITVLSTRPSFTGDNKTYPGDFCILRWKFQNGVCLSYGIVDTLVYERPRVE